MRIQTARIDWCALCCLNAAGCCGPLPPVARRFFGQLGCVKLLQRACALPHGSRGTHTGHTTHRFTLYTRSLLATRLSIPTALPHCALFKGQSAGAGGGTADKSARSHHNTEQSGSDVHVRGCVCVYCVGFQPSGRQIRPISPSRRPAAASFTPPCTCGGVS
jgi:hypothetical protein